MPCPDSQISVSVAASLIVIIVITILHDLTIDTEIKAKRNHIISELITFRITKAKVKVKFGGSIYANINAKDHLSQLISTQKRKRQNI